MKKIKKIFVFLFVTAFVLQIPFYVYAQNSDVKFKSTSPEATSKYAQTLALIDKTITKNEQEIEALKEKGVFEQFVNDVAYEMDKYVLSNYNESLEQLSQWNISPESTVYDIEVASQEYLNKHFNGIKIGSKDFDKMVNKYICNEDMGSRALADADHDFANLYLYMCIYNTYVLEKENSSIRDYSVYKNNSDIKNLLVSDIIYTDSQEDFIDTISPQILNRYTQAYAASSAWPKMNGVKIQDYARTYGNGYNGKFIMLDSDCTNFASQALFNGLLPMTFTSNDKVARGYVETKTRWFHFKTNASIFSVSTSWVRVVELYDYLSPHYAVHETSSGTKMTPYLNKGFLLQGKPFIGKYKHSVIVTINNGKVQYCAHSSNRKDEPIQTFYNGFYKYRVVQTY